MKNTQEKLTKRCIPNFELEVQDLPFDKFKVEKGFDLEKVKQVLLWACGGDDNHRGVIEFDLDVVNHFLQDERETKVVMLDTDNPEEMAKYFKADKDVYNLLIIQSSSRISVNEIIPICSSANEKDVAFAWLLNDNLMKKYQLTYLCK